MGGRRLFVVAGIVLAAAASGQASAASAIAVAWPGTVLTYRDATGGTGFHRAVLSAVAAWNRLELGVQLEPAPGQTDVMISASPGRCLRGKAGSAPLGFKAAGTQIVLRRSCPTVVRALLIAHELGRALGLPIDDTRCSLMNSRAVSDGLTYVVPAKCNRRHRPAWLRSLIDPATAKEARLLYTAPYSPGAIAVTPDARGIPTITWAEPAQPIPAVTVVARLPGICPTDRDVAAGTAAEIVYSLSAAGSHSVPDPAFPRTGGAQCYRAFDLNSFGRAASSPNAISYVFGGPVAGFAVSGAVAGAPTHFADGSTAPSGRSVSHWRWDFGDRASGSADIVDTSTPAAGGAPSHVFATPGTYEVTLTITDTAGLQSSMLEDVVVGVAA
jgi:hypothetical protein